MYDDDSVTAGLKYNSNRYTTCQVDTDEVTNLAVDTLPALYSILVADCQDKSSQQVSDKD